MEQEPLITLAEQGQLLAYKHEGFWQAMDTLREKTCWKTCGKAKPRRGKSGNDRAGVAQPAFWRGLGVP